MNNLDKIAQYIYYNMLKEIRRINYEIRELKQQEVVHSKSIWELQSERTDKILYLRKILELLYLIKELNIDPLESWREDLKHLGYLKY